MGRFTRHFGGKPYQAHRGYATKTEAQKEAKRVRSKAYCARVVPSDTHAKRKHGVNWEVFIRPD